MQIELRPRQEEFLAEQIRSGRFATLDEALHEAVSLLERAEAETAPAPRQNLADFLRSSPLSGSGLVIERLADSPRPLSL